MHSAAVPHNLNPNLMGDGHCQLKSVKVPLRLLFPAAALFRSQNSQLNFTIQKKKIFHHIKIPTRAWSTK
jgi:hypothetical protein